MAATPTELFLQSLPTDATLLGNFILTPNATLEANGISDADEQKRIRGGVAASISAKLVPWELSVEWGTPEPNPLW